jgi:hypothetical protein
MFLWSHDMAAAELNGLGVYPRSIVQMGETEFFLARQGQTHGKILGIRGEPTGFESASQATDDTYLCPLSAANASILRERLAWLQPKPLGVHLSFGFGDRLGSATPGHVQAVRDTNIAPIFAQQSVRENARTARTPQQVLDDALWGLFQEGWRLPWGADADHVKNASDLDVFIAAGYTVYTIDPGEHVDNQAPAASSSDLDSRVHNLPWDDLETILPDVERRYLGRPQPGCPTLRLDRAALWRAAAKYGCAIAHTAKMYRYLDAKAHQQAPAAAFEFEVSVDETDTPTSPAEHFFIASELHRLRVRWVSLAPRFVGRFEKGVDYIGGLDLFASEFAQHVAVAQALGPYKLSLHSGSDKFSVYPIVARLAGDLIHVKTAGTSYLEALRTAASVHPSLFRGIMAFASERYEEDRATYHVSARLAKMPSPARLADSDLPQVLDLSDARQILHVTFGSVVTAKDSEGKYRFRTELLSTLDQNEPAYTQALQAHLGKHLALLTSVD